MMLQCLHVLEWTFMIHICMHKCYKKTMGVHESFRELLLIEGEIYMLRTDNVCFASKIGYYVYSKTHTEKPHNYLIA